MHTAISTLSNTMPSFLYVDYVQSRIHKRNIHGLYDSTVKPLNRGHSGNSGGFSFVERLSLSLRFKMYLN